MNGFISIIDTSRKPFLLKAPDFKNELLNVSIPTIGLSCDMIIHCQIQKRKKDHVILEMILNLVHLLIRQYLLNREREKEGACVISK